MDQIAWPEKPICHGEMSPVFRNEEVVWRAARGQRGNSPYTENYRTCSYCGSIHPEDLLNALKAGTAKLGGSDWKYGYPHKFYVELPNPSVGQLHTDYTHCGAPSEEMFAEGGWEEYQAGFDSTTGEPKMSWRKPHAPRPAPQTMSAKWYNAHLKDLSPEAFAAFAPILSEHSGITFDRDENGIRYSSPYHGYQKP